MAHSEIIGVEWEEGVDTWSCLNSTVQLERLWNIAIEWHWSTTKQKSLNKKRLTSIRRTFRFFGRRWWKLWWVKRQLAARVKLLLRCGCTGRVNLRRDDRVCLSLKSLCLRSANKERNRWNENREINPNEDEDKQTACVSKIGGVERPGRGRTAAPHRLRRRLLMRLAHKSKQNWSPLCRSNWLFLPFNRSEDGKNAFCDFVVLEKRLDESSNEIGQTRWWLMGRDEIRGRRMKSSATVRTIRASPTSVIHRAISVYWFTEDWGQIKCQ